MSEMALQTEWIRYGEDRAFLGYRAVPAGVKEPIPAIIVLQEIWGVDEHIQDVTRRFAQAGYVALAPDLYAKGDERPVPLRTERIEEVKAFVDALPRSAWVNAAEREKELDKLPTDRRDRVKETFGVLFSGLNPELYIPQLLATTSFLRDEDHGSHGQAVGSVGFCMGGALSAALACHDPKLRGAVIFYGQPPKAEWVPHIACEVLGLYGGEDKAINDQIPAFAERMKAAGKTFEYHIYEGAHHAFFNDTRRSYHVGASRDAFARVLTFFNRVLV
jgi:carboxymethylenebutenolidase